MTYNQHWTRGLPTDPNFFPVVAMPSSSANIASYGAHGFNLVIGSNLGMSDADLAAIGAAHMRAVVPQTGMWSTHLQSPVIAGF